MSQAARIFLTHLRLPFQAVLAPFFLLGLVSAAIKPSTTAALGWTLAFLVTHIGLYGGATLYNSYYDKDRGPIGMLKSPPPVTVEMRKAAVWLQFASVFLLTIVRPLAGAISLVMMVLGIAYSHPRVRLKAKTFVGLVTVAFGQGALAVLLGYAVATAASPTNDTWLLAGAASLMAFGLYPLTQIYQISEDRGRGDRTLPVVIGQRMAFVFSGTMIIAGLGAMAFVLRDRLPWEWFVVWGVGAALMTTYLIWWAARFARLSPYSNHDRAMLLSAAVALPLTVYFLMQLMGFFAV